MAGGHLIRNTSPVGATHDFIAIERWPNSVHFTERNVFKVDHPFPVSERAADREFLSERKCRCRVRCTKKSKCINVSTATVCDETSCGAGRSCGNRFVTTRQLHLIKTDIGYGIVTQEAIPAGAFIVEYVGELLYPADALARDDKRYLVELKLKTEDGSALFIDAKFYGNASRFINHSCEPNCVMYEWDWTNTSRLGIFALSDIPPLTELAFAYRPDSL